MRMRPLAGRYRPIMCLSSVLFPDPDPPAITSTSLRRTSKVMSLSTVFPSYAAQKFSTRMIASVAIRGAAFRSWRLEAVACIGSA
jgi:hypothetical protein